MKVRGQTVYSLKERLRRLSAKQSSGCVDWISTTRNGYGRLMIGSRSDGTRRSVSAHRLAFEVYVGPIPDGLFVCHKCDNPKCVNADHLFIGTRQDNTDDRQAKGRNNPPAKLNQQVVKAIRSMHRGGMGYRTIARQFNVNKTSIRDIIKGKSWKKT